MRTGNGLSFVIVFLGLVIGTVVPATAAPDEIYTGAYSGVAINGYDPVAYFTQDKPVEGSQEITFDWKGVTWRFASSENRDLFSANPERYAPQYGGYCAFAVSLGSTATTDPSAFSIVDDKLYLNYSSGVKARWSKDIPGNISKGDANWPGIVAGK
ncbi:MAG: YHS domain-containing (seleno)protein [Nitratireductor sp.]